MTAKCGPRPRPGILDIAPYVPGRSALEGDAPVIKLSSNETPFGPSPYAVEAYGAASHSLFRYPDGSARGLREAHGKIGEGLRRRGLAHGSSTTPLGQNCPIPSPRLARSLASKVNLFFALPLGKVL